MRRLTEALAMLAATALVATGCGDDGSSGGGGTPQKPEKVKIGLIPIADVAPVFVGIKQGFFKEQGIELDPQFAAGGAAITAAVISGAFDIGFSPTAAR